MFSEMSDYGRRFQEACELYQRQDYQAAKESFEGLSSGGLSSSERRDCQYNIASCLACLGRFRDALEKFNSINLNTPDIQYNRALCNYKLSNFEDALDIVGDLLTPGRDFPAETPGEDRTKEFLNLKLAILFKIGSDEPEGVQDLIDRLLSRIRAEGLDNVALHNQSLCVGDIEAAANGLFSLIDETSSNREIPSETYANLVKLTLAQRDYSLANELIRKHREELSCNGSDLPELLEILAAREGISNKTICKKLELLIDRLIVGSSGQERKGDGQWPECTGQAVVELATKQLALIMWENNQYCSLERVLLKVEPILGELDFWRSWFAHSLFMQDTRYEECCFLYEKFLPTSSTPSVGPSLLSVDPIVLAQLCVSYLLTARNDAAESLIKKIELEEADILATSNNNNSQSRQLSHSCIVNLTIGQLYCVKLNFSFGLVRIFKTLEPLGEKLTSETWLVCKRCILALLDNHCKSMIFARDDLFDQAICFLKECERYGMLIRVAASYRMSARLETTLSEHEKSILMGRNSVTYEARYLRSLMLSVLHD